MNVCVGDFCVCDRICVAICVCVCVWVFKFLIVLKIGLDWAMDLGL